MFYTTICTLLYAAIHLYKKSKSDIWPLKIVVGSALAGLLLLGSGTCNSAAAQNLRVAYFGETLTHYGVRSGMEFNLHHAEKDKPGGRIATNDLYFGITLTAYRHPHNHIGLILAPELGWRHTGRRGGILQAALSPGLFRSFYEGKTWKSGENGQFKRVPLAGQWGFMPGISAGFGHQFGKRDNAWYCNLHYLRQYPYNHSFLNRIALEAGVLTKLNLK
jgi:hypothetical protein